MKNYYWEVAFGEENLKIRLLKRPTLNVEEKWNEVLGAYVPGVTKWEQLDLICELGQGRKIINSSPLNLSLLLKSVDNNDLVEQWDLENVVTTENEIDHDIIEVNFKGCRFASNIF